MTQRWARNKGTGTWDGHWGDQSTKVMAGGRPGVGDETMGVGTRMTRTWVGCWPCTCTDRSNALLRWLEIARTPAWSRRDWHRTSKRTKSR